MLRIDKLWRMILTNESRIARQDDINESKESKEHNIFDTKNIIY